MNNVFKTFVRMTTLLMAVLIGAALCVSASCGGGSQGAASPDSSGGDSVSVTLLTRTVTVVPGGTVQFSVTVTGTTNTAVTWSMVSGGGTVSSSGLYTAPGAAGTATVKATSVADSTKSDTATVTISGSVPPGNTYYISPSGSDGNSCTAAQNSTTPKKSFSSAWKCLSAGSTLIVADGTYNGDASPPSSKSGIAGNPIMIRAANDFGATINQISASQQVRLGSSNSYITYHGFVIVGSNQVPGDSTYGENTGCIDLQSAAHNTFQKVACMCNLLPGVQNDGTCISVSDSNNNVFEDFWVWGGGRYTIMDYSGSYNTYRRGVIRMGPDTSRSDNPQAGLAIYYTNHDLVENVLVIDSHPASGTSNSSFYVTGHAPPPDISNNRFFGIMALNSDGGAGNRGAGIYIDVDGGGTVRNTEVHNSVFWKTGDTGMLFYASNTNNCSGAIVDHVTVGASVTGGGYESGCPTALTNSIFVNNRGTALSSFNSVTVTSNYNILFGNGGSYSGVNGGSQDITNQDPALSYIAGNITSGPAFHSDASGGNRGADLSFRYQDGVLTSTPLWPWSDEQTIKPLMCGTNATYNGSNSTFGWCATNKTLTDYVWGYLGHPTPSQVSPGKSTKGTK